LKAASGAAPGRSGCHSRAVPSQLELRKVPLSMKFQSTELTSAPWATGQRATGKPSLTVTSQRHTLPSADAVATWDVRGFAGLRCDTRVIG